MRDELLWPMAVLALWTVLILLVLPAVRIRAVLTGRVREEDFKHGESTRVPHDVTIFNRAYINLLELPVLFYVAALAAMVTGRVDAWTLRLAWAFVAVRIVQDRKSTRLNSSH